MTLSNFEKPASKKFLLGNMRSIQGSAETPNSSDNRVILFPADISGNIENELTKKIIKRWEKSKIEYRVWWRGQVNFKLGQILPITVQTDTTILLALVLKDNVLDLPAMKTAMINAGKYCSSNKFNFHLNKLNENWNEIETMLTDYFIKSGVNVTIYEKEVK